MRRRDFIAAIGGTALAWPSAVQAQQSGSVRRVGILIPFDSGDPYAQSLVAAFKQRLYDLGWIENRNIRLEYRYQGSDIERIRAGVAELVALAPDIIVVWSNPAVAVLRQATQTIPLFLCWCPSRLEVASSRTWRIQAAISPVSRILNLQWEGNGCSCSRRLRLLSNELLSFTIRT